jgi:rsbT antagonist protein RsbS
MEDVSDFSTFGMHMADNFMVVPVNAEIDDDYVMQLRKGILEKVKATGTKGVLIDVSAVRVLDAFTFSILADTARMVSMLGADVVLVGFQAGVASALVDLEIDMGDIPTAVTMDDGFDLLRCQASSLVETDEPEAETIVTDPDNPDYPDDIREINETNEE